MNDHQLIQDLDQADLQVPWYGGRRRSTTPPDEGQDQEGIQAADQTVS